MSYKKLLYEQFTNIIYLLSIQGIRMMIAGLHAILQEIAILTKICQHIVRLMEPVTISKTQHTVQQKQN